MSRGRARRDATLAAVAPLVLCTVAAIHLLCVAACGLSAWKGGGFGMFSTVDAPHARFLRVVLIDGRGGELPILVPPEWQTAAQKVRTMPTARRVRALGRELVATDWTRYEILSPVEHYRQASGEVAAAPAAPDGDPPLSRFDMTPFGFVHAASEEPGARRAAGALDVRALRLEVWRYRFDRRASALTAERIHHATFARPR